MADIPASRFRREFVLPELAPDLTYPSSKSSDGQPYYQATGINASAGLTTVLSLTGSFAISMLGFESMTAEQVTIVLTVDGEVKWNDTFTLSSDELWLLGSNSSPVNNIPEAVYGCRSSLTLEIQTATDTSIDFLYMVRPIV